MKKVLLLLLSLSLVSCATNMVDKAGVSQIKESKGVLLTIGPEEGNIGHYYKVGAQGLLDVLLTSGGGKDIKAIMKTLDAVELSKNALVPGLKDHLSSITHKEQYLNEYDLEKRSNKQSGEFKYDLSKYTTGYDYAVVLDINRYGAARPFWGFIPTGAPKGNAHLDLLIVDLNTYKVLAEVTTTADVPVDGDWRQEPEYTNLKHSSVEAFNKATQNLVEKVFE